jgi:hypothetical protein
VTFVTPLTDDHRSKKGRTRGRLSQYSTRRRAFDCDNQFQGDGNSADYSNQGLSKRFMRIRRPTGGVARRRLAELMSRPCEVEAAFRSKNTGLGSEIDGAFANVSYLALRGFAMH